jgi:cytochrome c oxidase subunit 2
MPKSASNRKHFIIVGVLVVITAIVMGWILNTVLPLPTAAATQAGTLDALFRVHMWLIAILFALVVVFMVYSLVVFRRGKSTDEGDHFEGNTTLEILWTAIPLVIVVVFSYIGIRTLAEVTAAPPDELVVKVDGQQWNWLFTYPNGTQSPDLVVPVNQNLTMEMNSKDVIHSFWVPEWRVKQDVVPGMTTHVHYTTDKVGEYSLLCNQICGYNHTGMIAKVRVVPKEEFTAWLQDQLAAQSQQTASR